MVVDLERMKYSEIKPVEVTTTLEHTLLGCEMIYSLANLGFIDVTGQN